MDGWHQLKRESVQLTDTGSDTIRGVSVLKLSKVIDSFLTLNEQIRFKLCVDNYNKKEFLYLTSNLF